MRSNSPEIEATPISPLGRKLSITEWILFAVGIAVFAGGMMVLGPLKFTAAIVFIVLVAVAFFSPKYGLYVLFGMEGLYILVFYINLMALAPSQIGLDYTISYTIEGSHLFIIPLAVLMFAYFMGFMSRLWLSGERYMPGSFEGTLIGFLIFAAAWTSIGIANENFPLTILTDLHVVFILAFGIFAGRSFRDIKEFRTLLNFIIIVSLIHWVFLIGYFIQQRLYTEFLFIMDLIRAIQGTSDLYSPLIPVMLAIFAFNGDGKPSRLEKYYPHLVFLFFIRTILCLSRGAVIQVVVGIIALYFMLPKENRRILTALLKRQLVYLFIFCALIFIASPSLATFGFKIIGGRVTDTGREARESVSTSSLKYRRLETQMVLESIVDSPIIGYGPGKQTKKRMFIYTSAAEEPYVHNGYLWYMLKFGAIGLLFLGYLFMRYFISVNKSVRGSANTARPFLIGTAAAVIGILPIVLTNNVIGAVQGVVFVSYAFGVVIFAERQMFFRKSGESGEGNATD